MSYMLVEEEQRIAQEWEKYKGFTVRPLPSTEAYYHDLIERQPQKTRFMLYGGTPEIRTIFQDCGRKVVMVDRSGEMIRAMGRLTRRRTGLADNEDFIASDWLDVSRNNLRFDFLIGDDAINMVSWNDYAVFLQNAADLLDESGLFVCHLLVKPDEYLINQNFDTLADEFRTGKIKNRYDLASRLNYICYDQRRLCMGWQQTIQMLGEDKLGKLRPDFDFVETFGLCNSQFFCPPQSEFETLANRYFMIEEIFYPYEHEYCR